MEKKQKENVIKAYKGFDNKLQCRGFQYEVGKKYEMNGKISCCRNGFHACQSPLEVLDYYFLLTDGKMARFCEVEQAGTIDEENDGSTKIASSKIKINRELTLSELIRLGIEWLEENTNKITDTYLSDDGENQKKIGSSGYSVQITSSGNYVKIGSNGDNAKIGSSGAYAKIGSSGNYAKIGSSGSYAHIASSGDVTKMDSIGDCAKIGSNGDNAKIGSSGYNAKIGSSGNYAKIASSGDNSKIGSSGNDTKIASNGDDAYVVSSGDYVHIGSSGNNSMIVSTGDDSLICCTGRNSIAKAKKGSWITLTEWKWVKDEKKSRWVPKCVKTEYVDGERIKSDTLYKLIDGEFKEVE